MAYYLQIDTTALKVLLARTSGPFGSPEVAQALGDGVRQWGVLVQARAVRNVTGYPVVYEGGVFRVQVVTGTLRNSIELQWPYGSAFQARVFVNGTFTNPGSTPGRGGRRVVSVAEYANSIEHGHGEIDLKQTMRGKTVPFFGAKAQKARGPFTARGLEPVDANSTDYGSGWRSAAHDAKLAAKGKGPMIFEKKGGDAAFHGGSKGASTYFISFRKVGDTGWVIPEARPRPFMRAALEGTKDQGRRMLINRAVAALQGGHP